jgi:hypothetical protein
MRGLNPKISLGALPGGWVWHLNEAQTEVIEMWVINPANGCRLATGCGDTVAEACDNCLRYLKI